MTLEIITSDALSPVRHGFFTRRGGLSKGVYKGLNCGIGSNDQREVVNINRDLVSEAMGVERENLCSVYQIHSSDVVAIDAPLSQRPKADAMVTNQTGIALGVLTADCAPILLSDMNAGVIGAAHSGWKGAIAGVAQNTIEAMIQLGAKREDIRATIGPCISQRAYEVGPEFLEDFLLEDPSFSRFFAGGINDKLHFDLPAFCIHQIRNVGVETNWTGHCTYSDADRFYSYRRKTHLNEPDYGRLISTIVLEA